MANIVLDGPKLREIDKNEKNKFRCDWMTKSVKLKLGDKELDVKVGDNIKKVEVSGKAICQLCCDYIYYGKRGYGAISDHLNTKKHMEKVFLKSSNYSLPCNFFSKSSTSSTSSVPAQMSVPLCDRVSNSEALVLGVIAEHSLLLSMAPVLIELIANQLLVLIALHDLDVVRSS